MSADQDANVGTTPVRFGFALDIARLECWMRENVQDFRGPMTVEQFKGGQSNPTYKLGTPRRSYVLRKQPPGALLRGAHAVDREVAVLRALESAGFPVAHVYGFCPDDSVLGTIFYVMAMVDGEIFWDASVPDVSINHRRQIFDSMNATIAALHNIDVQSAGLETFGRSGNYFERQIARWSKQYLEDIDAGRDENMDRLIEWLPANIPEGDETTIVHGDFRIDNMIFDRTGSSVLAVLDWELSTLGHPGSDFAYHAMMYRMPPHIVAGLHGADLRALGIPNEADYLAAYCARRGIAGMPGYAYYIAFNFFRLAAIFHGIKGRVIRGSASSAKARERAIFFPELAAISWQQADTSGG